jgi:hypothetical protein
MANLNLSQFTEKTLVADADWVFVWDTTGAISKKVSRNSLLNSGTLVTSAPVTISQTWNDAAVTFTAFKVNATSTNSATGSLLLDLQVGGSSQLKVSRTGFLTIGSGNAKLEYEPGGTLNLKRSVDGLATISINPEGNTISAGTLIPVSRIANSGLTAAVDFNDGANTFAVRNGAAGQTFSVYGTYPNATQWERFSITAPTSGNVLLGTYKGTSGLARGLDFQTEGTSRWTITSAGNLIGTTDNSVDIGAQGANRPKIAYLSNSFRAPSGYVQYGAAGGLYFNGNDNSTGWVGMTARAVGVITIDNFAGGDFNRLQLGGTTDAFPAIKRVGAEFQIVKANTTAAINVAALDADMTFIEDRFRRKGAGSPEGVVTAPIGAVYHNTTGGAGTSFYVKESGTGNTGWVGK